MNTVPLIQNYTPKLPQLQIKVQGDNYRFAFLIEILVKPETQFFWEPQPQTQGQKEEAVGFELRYMMFCFFYESY